MTQSVDRYPERRINKAPDEDNWDYCRRAAAAVIPEVLIQDLVKLLQKKDSEIQRLAHYAPNPEDEDDEDNEIEVEVHIREPWTLIGEATNHGSGFSSAIAERFKLGE